MGSEWLNRFLWTSGAATVLSSVKLLCWEGKHQCPSCLYNSLLQFTPQLLLGVHLWALLFCSVGVVGLSEAEVDVSMLGALTYILCFFWAATGEFARVVALNQNNLLCVLNPGWSGFLFIFFTSFQCLVPLMWSNREPYTDTYIPAGINRPLTPCVRFWEHYSRAEELLCWLEGQRLFAGNNLRVYP